MPILSSFQSESLIADHRHYHQSPTFHPHIHDAYEILFLTKGEASYTVEGKTYPLHKGSLVITRPLKVHCVTLAPGSEYRRYDILFDDSVLDTDVCRQLPPKLDVIHFAGNTMIADLFKKFGYYCSQLSGPELQTVLAHLTEEILFNVHIAARDAQERSSYTTHPLVKQAIKYIERHLTEPLTVEAVCQELHISQSYLLHLFAHHLNISPKKYIMSKRLAMAQMALRSGARPAEVCRQCGFSDYTTFFRAYKNHFGHAPAMETDQQTLRILNS